MSPRKLKIALAVSVAVNLFVVGALAGGLVVGARYLADRSPPPEPPAFRQSVDRLDPEQSERVRQSLRQSALEARDDFRRSRAARREAVELAGAESFDADAVRARLAESREAELRARARLEDGTVEIMQTLEREDRQRLSGMLMRQSPRMRPSRMESGAMERRPVENRGPAANGPQAARD